MSKRVPVDRATPRITGGRSKPTKMVDSANKSIAAILGSSNISKAGGVASAANDWSDANTALDTNNQNKAKGHALLEAAILAEPPLVRRWYDRTVAVETAIRLFADGSKEVAQSFEVPVAQKTTTPEATVPQNLRPMKVKKPSNASGRWDKVPGATGYLLQHASNPNDPSTYSAPINCTGVMYHLPGQTVGTTVYFRVLAIDKRLPGGQTAYTAWVAVLVAA